MRVKENVAHKWCKEEESVEGGEVSSARTADFHKLINICVEILTKYKYFLRTSARVLPCGPCHTFDRREIAMIEYKSGCTR